MRPLATPVDVVGELGVAVTSCQPLPDRVEKTTLSGTSRAFTSHGLGEVALGGRSDDGGDNLVADML